VPVDSPAITAPVLSLTDVTVRHGSEPTIEGISLSLYPGEIITVIGPNGAGKSTLIKTALGIIKPDSGKVGIADNTVIGYVPQSVSLDPSLPIAVDRFLKLSGIGERSVQNTVLEQVGAQHLINASMHRLSGGEMRRVLLARALLKRPDLLILDEPTSGVDINGQAALYTLIQAIRDQYQCAVLLVSHDLHIVMAATDQVLCLNRHMCCQGRPEQVRAHPEYLAIFGAREAASIGVYRHHHDHDHGLAGDVCQHD